MKGLVSTIDDRPHSEKDLFDGLVGEDAQGGGIGGLLQPAQILAQGGVRVPQAHLA